MTSLPLKSIRWKLFVAFLALGLSSGLFLGKVRTSTASASPQSTGAQVNYLFAVVSDEEGGVATLQALWLAAAHPATGQVSWIPLYPQPLNDADGRSAFSRNHESIRLSGGIDSLLGLPLLRELGIQWEHALILDPEAAKTIASLLGIAPEDRPAVQSAFEPQLALKEQVRTIQAFCSGALDVAGSLDTILLLFPDHIRSSLNQFEIITHWDFLSARDFALDCDHPWAE
jgi:hypothetical protein